MKGERKRKRSEGGAFNEAWASGGPNVVPAVWRDHCSTLGKERKVVQKIEIEKETDEKYQIGRSGNINGGMHRQTRKVEGTTRTTVKAKRSVSE